MKKQMTIISAVLVGLVFILAGNAWAEREHPRDRGEGQHFRDRGRRGPDREARSGPSRQWRGREDRSNGFHKRGHSNRRPHVRRHHDGRWKPRKAHRGPQRHWRHNRGPQRRHHWRTRGHHRPPRFHRRHHRGRWQRGHQAFYPVVEKHIYHPYTAAVSEAETAPAAQFELAAAINDPSGTSFSFGVSHSP